MKQEQLKPYRSRVLGGAKGRVLEIGFGSGRNLPYYTSEANEVIGIDV
jgi:tRNA G46 methylase TrmB